MIWESGFTYITGHNTTFWVSKCGHKETEACRWVTRGHHPKPIEDSAAEDLSPLREGIKVGLSVGNGDRCAQEHWAVFLGRLPFACFPLLLVTVYAVTT